MNGSLRWFAGFLLAALAYASTADARPITVSGHVFVDANRNGQKDADERGLANVPVSDGENITMSGLDGSYTLKLDVQEDRFIFVTAPTGFAPSRTFFHRIEAGIAESKVEASFGLESDTRWGAPDGARHSFSFLVTADSQFTTKEEQALLIEEFSEMNAVSQNPAFFFIVGDLTMNGTFEELDMYRGAAARITNFPLFNIFGGHDGNSCARSVRNFQAKIGPPYFSWDCGGIHFIALTTETGYLSKESNDRQWAWVERDLALQPKTKPIVIACHIAPPRDIFAQWASRHNIKAVFLGHWHENTVYTQNGVPFLITGPIRGRDWGALTRSFRVCRFRAGDLTTELRFTGQDKRLDIVCPPADGVLPAGKIPLVVNAYDTVSWIREAKAELTTAKGVRTEYALKQESDWCWRGEWNAAQEQVLCRLKVTVRNDRGESWERETSVTIGDGKPPLCKPATAWPQIVRTFEEGRTTPDIVRPPLALAWCAPTGGDVWTSSPIAADGLVFIGVEDEDLGWPGAGVVAFDAVTGARLWKTRTESVRHTVAYEGGRVFALSEQGIVYGLDARNGRILWKAEGYPPEAGFRGAKSSCVTHKGRVLALLEYGPLLALDAATGKEIWRVPLNIMLRQSCPTVYGDTVYVAGRETVAAFSLDTGAQQWREKVTVGVGRSVSPPIRKDGTLFVAGGTTVAYDAAPQKSTDRILWKTATSTGATYAAFCPVIWNDKLIAGGADLVALDVKTGKPLWRHSPDSDPALFERNKRQVLSGLSAPAVSGNTLYVGKEDGYFYALDAETGKTLWRYRIGVPIKSSPVVTGNAVYVGACDGNVYAFVGR